MDLETQDYSLSNAFSEFDTVHADGDEFATRVVQGGGDPGKFIDPLQQVAAEQITVVVEVFRENKFVVLQGLSRFRHLQSRWGWSG